MKIITQRYTVATTVNRHSPDRNENCSRLFLFREPLFRIPIELLYYYAVRPLITGRRDRYGLQKRKTHKPKSYCRATPRIGRHARLIPQLRLFAAR